MTQSPDFREGTLLRVFIDEADRWHGQPLYTAIVEKLRSSGISGATVLKGIEGYGSHRAVHAARTIDFSSNLPIVVEVIEEEEKIRAFLPTLHEIIGEGLITLERVQFARITGKTAT